MRRESFSAVRVVLFDAVGTLIYPKPGAAEVYRAIGSRFGVQLPIEEIAARFRAALHRHTQDCGEATNEEHERSRWRGIVADVLPAEGDRAESIFLALWDHFSRGENWRVFDDAEETWRGLGDLGLTVGVASNFDSRLVSICKSIPWLSDCPRVFTSAMVGFAKPNRRYFEAIERRLGARGEQILLVGDDLANDFEGARAAGWKAIWIDRREARVGGVSVADRIGDLRQLLKFFQSA
jgi:putative hydrolase of the HAD superfamily